MSFCLGLRSEGASSIRLRTSYCAQKPNPKPALGSVGEATVEVSAFFMGRVLGLTQYLNESHLVKQGLRFWFTNDEVKSLDEASELGGHYQVRLPSYQLDRANCAFVTHFPPIIISSRPDSFRS